MQSDFAWFVCVRTCSQMNHFDEACSFGWGAHMVKMVTERGHLALQIHMYSLIGHARSHYQIKMTTSCGCVYLPRCSCLFQVERKNERKKENKLFALFVV